VYVVKVCLVCNRGGLPQCSNPCTLPRVWMVIAGIVISVAPLPLVSILYLWSLVYKVLRMNWTNCCWKPWLLTTEQLQILPRLLLQNCYAEECRLQSGITEFRFVCGTSAQLAQSCIRQNELLLGHLRILCGSKWWVQWVKPRRVEQLQQSSTGTPSKRPCQKLLFRPKRVGEQEVCALCGLRDAFLDSKIHASSLLPALAPVK